MIRAAGAIVWRETTPLSVEFLLVHRPKYDDWSFPKGKVDLGESAIQAAYREVLEETGLETTFGPYIGSNSYDIEGEKKKVKYWMAKAKNFDVPFIPNDEVDRIEWVPKKLALHFLTHKDDKDLLKKFLQQDRHTQTLVLLRHAKAVKRAEWNDYDLDRPLNEVGIKQAEKLVKQFIPYDIDGIYSSDAIRCYSTVEKFAAAISKPITLSKDLNEETFNDDSKKAYDFARQLLLFPGNYVICGHNPILPSIAKKLSKLDDVEETLEPADAWVIYHRGEKILGVTHVNAPTA